jgi:hypothetical protein
MRMQAVARSGRRRTGFCLDQAEEFDAPFRHFQW